MQRNIESIETDLTQAELILKQHSDLYHLALDELLDIVETESDDVKKEKWSIIAWIVFSSLQSENLDEIIKQLCLVQAMPSDMYIGFLLHRKLHIDLVELLLYADKIKHFERIANLACESLPFQQVYNNNNLFAFLLMLENHLQDKICKRLLSAYAKHIDNSNSFASITDALPNLESESQYDLLCYISNLWYKKDVNQADEALEHYLYQDNIWSHKAAIYFLSFSIYHNPEIYDRCFNRITTAVKEYEDYLLAMQLSSVLFYLNF